MRKTSAKPRLGHMLQDTRLEAFLFTTKVMKKQGKTKKLSQARGDWGDMTTKYDAIPRFEYWNRKRTVSKIQIKCGNYLTTTKKVSFKHELGR